MTQKRIRGQSKTGTIILNYEYNEIGLYMGDEFEIDLELCLQTLAKLKQGDFSNFTEIENIESHIQNLKNAISHELSHL